MNCKTGLYGIIAAFIIPALPFLASCEMPESVRVKASPTFAIPIPLGDGVDNSFIRPYVNTETIQERLSGAGKTVSVSKYADPDIQTYLINYPLFEMNLDFNTYINEPIESAEGGISRVPDMVISQELADRAKEARETVKNFYGLGEGQNLPYSYWVRFEPLKIDLGDMKSLVSNICLQEQGAKFILEADTLAKAEQLQKAIRIRIPQLKIGTQDYAENAWVQGNNPIQQANKYHVVFEKKPAPPIDKGEPVLLIPDDWSSETIEIQISLANTIDAGTYKTELEFNWSKADVSPRAGSTTGEIDGFDLSSYLSELGGDNVTVKFSQVPAYLYVKSEGLENEPDISISGSGIVPTNKADIFWPDSDKIDSSLAWLTEDNKNSIKNYDFSALDSKATIRYKVEMPQKETIYNDGNNIRTITANLTVLLPMTFTFEPKANAGVINITKPGYGGSYLPINFEGLDNFLGSGDSGNDSVMDQIDEQLGDGGITGLTLRLRDIKNNVTSSIFLAVVTDSTKTTNPQPNDWDIVEIADNSEGEEFSIKNVQSLAGLPPVKFLLKKEGQPEEYKLSIKPSEDETEGKSAFSVKISVVAGINLDKTIELK